MMQKFCPGCGKCSYSADAKGQWICPYCGKDITEEQPDPPGGFGVCKDTGTLPRRILTAGNKGRKGVNSK